ncbi:MAG: hypothetical protein HDQ96_07235 [Lachnospiraceae bacterium]|nr:hypothetical protein [Lachnospiraceae bacterium]
MKKWNRILPVVFIVFLLTGCGKTTIEMTTIAIQKDGKIEHTLVEDFDGGSVDALRNMMSEKAAAYNNSNPGGGVAVDTVEADEGVVRVVMTYPDAVSFDGFMNMDVVEVDPALRAPFFYGTVEEAFMQGFDLEIELQGVEGEKTLQGKDDILSMGKNKIIIYDNEMNLGAPVQISVQDKPLYISDNVTVAGKNLVEISETDELAYILLEG